MRRDIRGKDGGQFAFDAFHGPPRGAFAGSMTQC
jgi:hypothetical protein